MIKMVVSDLDGTLLKKGESKIEQEVLTFIKEQRAAGQWFAIASGRSYAELKAFFAQVLYDMYFICENGAMVIYQGKAVMKRTLGRRLLEQLISHVEAEGYEWVAAGVHTIYTSKKNQKVSAYYKNEGLSIMKLASAKEIPEEILRVSVCCEGADREVLIQDLQGIAKEKGKVIFSDDRWIDIVAGGVDKGIAVGWLCDAIGIEREQLAVFGDNLNDIGMLQMTDNSYAMEWAADEVKKYARFTTDCVMRNW